MTMMMLFERTTIEDNARAKTIGGVSSKNNATTNHAEEEGVFGATHETVRRSALEGKEGEKS